MNAGDLRQPLPVLSLDRRSFLGALAAGVGALGWPKAEAASEAETSSGFVDVNVSLGPWPARRVGGDTAGQLVTLLREQGVTQAWIGSLDALLHRDVAGVNRRLAQACAQESQGLFLPFGAVNPTLPDWEDDLRRCALDHRMPGIRLHPNYHGYTLDNPVFARLLDLASEHGLIVQLALVMEDERMMQPLLRVPPVNTAPLAGLVRAHPRLRLVLLNALRVLRGQPLRDLAGAGHVSVEISMLEGVGGVGQLLQQLPADRVLFGSHAPLFYFQSAALKLRESPLTDVQLEALRSRNARRLLATDKPGG